MSRLSMVPGWVEPCLRAGGFRIFSENRRRGKINQVRMAGQAEPGTCWGLLPLAQPGESCSWRADAVTATLHPYPERSGSLTPSISLPEHACQGCSPRFPPPQGEWLPSNCAGHGQGGGKMCRLGVNAGAGTLVPLSGAESELTISALLWKAEIVQVWVPLMRGSLEACSWNLNFLLLCACFVRGFRLLLPWPERAGREIQSSPGCR